VRKKIAGQGGGTYARDHKIVLILHATLEDAIERACSSGSSRQRGGKQQEHPGHQMLQMFGIIQHVQAKIRAPNRAGLHL